MTNSLNVACNFSNWQDKLRDTAFNLQLKGVLLGGEAAMQDAFYKYLEFGTGGLRGVMGIGTNRMNVYTVAKATLGLGKYLLFEYGEDAKEKGVAIAYDSRNLSFEFAQRTAFCLNSLGIKTYLFKNVTPAPMLSFTVNYLACVAGIVITASHNPPKYNGYKVYDQTGCQITEIAAAKISEYIMASDEFVDLSSQNAEDKLYNIIDEEVNNVFYSCVLKYSLNDDIENKKNLKAVYSPLHGSGNLPVRKTLERANFAIEVVKEQENPDGNFSTVKTPNPEDRQALSLAIKQAKDTDADIAFGTDPDCDRIGIAVKQGSEYILLSGNQIGALIIDYILKKKFAEKSISKNATVVKTIVTNELGADIARAYGINIADVLTGFKYIGEKIAEYGIIKDSEQGMDKTVKNEFLFGYEESFGFLIGTYAKDKDAIGAALMLCEMAAEYKAQGYTLIDHLNDLYAQYGYYLDALDSFEFEGIEGAKRISNIMALLRENSHKLFGDILGIGKIDTIKDYYKGIENLPKSNVIKIFFKDGSWLAARPSGTEPKIKFYYSIKAQDNILAQKKLESLQRIIYSEVK